MNETTLLLEYLVVGALLFAIGLVGFVTRRNMIIMFIAAEMMLQGVSLSLVAWGRYHGDWGGQMLVIFIIAVAASEAAVALAMILMMFQRTGELDIVFWQQEREANLPAFVDQELPAEPDVTQHWPTLTPAGREPRFDQEEITHRTHV